MGMDGSTPADEPPQPGRRIAKPYNHKHIAGMDRRRLIALSLAPALLGLVACGRNTFPPRAERALSVLKDAELVSLEPWAPDNAPGRRMHGYLVLGSTKLSPRDAQAAASAIRSSVASWDGVVAACFDPRHALRTRSSGHTYEVLICYACASLEVFEDGRPIASTGVSGSPEALNRILLAAHVPISHSEEELAAKVARENPEGRWLEGMPRSVRPLWKGTQYLGVGDDLRDIRAALSSEFPDRQARILALLRWYGSGAGPWSGYPSYEGVAEELLLEFPTAEIVRVAQSAALSDDQLEGAARLLGGWEFGQQRPKDQALVPHDLRKRLLAHSLKSDDQDKRARAREAFGS
jgi:hypothetical protein